MRQTLLEIRLIDDSGARGPSPDSLVFHGGSKEKLGEFPGAPATHQKGSTGVEKVYSLVGFRWPGHRQHERCIYAYAPDADKRVAHPFLSAPSHGNAAEAFARTCSPTTRPCLRVSPSRFTLSFSFPLLCHCFTPSLTPSTLAPLFSFCVRQPARFRAAKEYLKRCSRASFEPPSPPSPNVHPHLGDIIHYTANTVYLSEPAFQFASLIFFAPCNHNTRKVAQICTALYGS